MSLSPVVGELHTVKLGVSNAFLLDEGAAAVTLIDTGMPGKEGVILDALRNLGRQPGDVRRILLTHGHPDHIGSAAAMARATGAEVWVHPADREIVESGRGFRPLAPSPGLVNHVLLALIRRFVLSRTPQVEKTPVTGLLEDGAVLPIAGGLRVFHVPGHCAGQVALLWEKHGGVLIAADSCMHQGRLGMTMGYENVEQGRTDLRRLAALTFETACFGHGAPLSSRASNAFRQKFAR